VVEARRAQYSEFVAALELSVASDYPEPCALLKVLKAQPGWFQTLAGKRQLAILFSFVQSKQQPTEAIAELLREAENRTVVAYSVVNPGSGYEEGKSPLVTVTPPGMGSSLGTGGGGGGAAASSSGGGSGTSAAAAATAAAAEATSRSATATAYSRLRPSGKVLRIEVVDGGSGYSAKAPPSVSVEAAPFSLGRATARAIVDPTSGAVVAVEVVDVGSGYGRDVPFDPKTESYFDPLKKSPSPPPPPTVAIAAPLLQPPPPPAAGSSRAPTTTLGRSTASTSTSPDSADITTENTVASSSASSTTTTTVTSAKPAKAVAVLDYEVAAVFVATEGFGYSGPGLAVTGAPSSSSSSSSDYMGNTEVTIAPPATLPSTATTTLIPTPTTTTTGPQQATAVVKLSPPQRLVEEYPRIKGLGVAAAPFVLAGETVTSSSGRGSSSSSSSSSSGMSSRLTALLPATLPVSKEMGFGGVLFIFLHR
jgi:hypothetical protein